MKNNALAYSLKIWLTAVWLGSFLLTAFMSGSTARAHNVNFAQQFVLITFLEAAISIFFSIPSFAIMLLASWGLCNVSVSNILRKLLLTAVGIGCCLLALQLIKNHNNGYLGEIGLITPYFVVAIAAIWFYKLKTDKDEPVEAC